jgi:hypothetical protein
MMFAGFLVAGRFSIILVEIFVLLVWASVAVWSLVAAVVFAVDVDCHAAACFLILLAGVPCDGVSYH